jgi:hypothetical protein
MTYHTQDRLTPIGPATAGMIQSDLMVVHTAVAALVRN